MAASLDKSNKTFKRLESKKSHSWWWDSHVAPKNSKWLAENLEEMDQSVKRMLKLIEEDGDSFAKKAEMYYKKRPELISHVEEFYRMYRSLAERYDNVTGELRKSMPSDLQSQGSGQSDAGSEPPLSSYVSPDQRIGRRKSGPRAAGFDVFLKTSGGSSDFGSKLEGSETSTLDSESESDDSSINNYSSASGNGDDTGLRKKISELEVELRNAKEKLQMQEKDLGDAYTGMKNGGSEGLVGGIAEYEKKLRSANEKIQKLEEEVKILRELRTSEDSKTLTSHNELEEKPSNGPKEAVDGEGVEFSDPEAKICALEEEVKTTRKKLVDSDGEVKRLRRELETKLSSAQKDISTWKAKVDKEKREVSKLQDRIVRYKANIAERDQEIRALRETVSNANKSLSEENVQLQAEVTKLLKEKTYLEDRLKEWDLRCQSAEEEVRRLKVAKDEMENDLRADINLMRDIIADNDETIAGLHKKVLELDDEITSKDEELEQMRKHLHQLHVEHAELISEIESTRKEMEEIKLRDKELAEEVERQREVIMEGAEEKREAIRQLCFSIEHYRDGYQTLRKAFIGHKGHPVMAS